VDTVHADRPAGDGARRAAAEDGLPVAWTQAELETAVCGHPDRPVLLRGSGEFFLDAGNAWATDDVTVYAIGQADVAAFDHAAVFAADSVYVMAQDDARVRLVGSASCWTAGRPVVEARDHAIVAVWQGGQVRAFDDATVVYGDAE
jgi:hypothetical protein